MRRSEEKKKVLSCFLLGKYPGPPLWRMWHILCVNCPPDVKTNDCFVYDKRRDGVYVCVCVFTYN